MQPVSFVRAAGVPAVISPSSRPSPAGRGSHGSTATASQTRRVVQRGPVAPPLPAGEGRGEGERGPVENGQLHFHGSGGQGLLSFALPGWQQPGQKVSCARPRQRTKSALASGGALGGASPVRYRLPCRRGREPGRTGETFATTKHDLNHINIFA